VPDLDPEDAKIVTLARGARLRAHAPHTGVAEGAAVRDTDGRTYAGATVENADPGLTTSALRAAVAAAASSGARTFEAAAVVGGALVSEADVAVLREFGVGVPLLLAGDDGVVHHSVTT
jgi:cytidine deaminase